jgi:hypothetical protein
MSFHIRVGIPSRGAVSTSDISLVQTTPQAGFIFVSGDMSSGLSGRRQVHVG